MSCECPACENASDDSVLYSVVLSACRRGLLEGITDAGVPLAPSTVQIVVRVILDIAASVAISTECMSKTRFARMAEEVFRASLEVRDIAERGKGRIIHTEKGWNT